MSPGPKDVEKIASEAEFAMAQLLDRQGGEPVRVHDAIRGALREIDDRRERGGKLAGQSTGFESIDWITGGLEPGQLVILAARPSVGKTALALNIADHVASTGAPALFFTLEMTGQELAMRLMASRSGVPSPEARREWQEGCSYLRGKESCRRQVCTGRAAGECRNVEKASRAGSRGLMPGVRAGISPGQRPRMASPKFQFRGRKNSRGTRSLRRKPPEIDHPPPSRRRRVRSIELCAGCVLRC